MTKPPFKKFLRRTAIMTICIAAMVAAFNMLVDPYRAYCVINNRSFNACKYPKPVSRIPAGELIHHGKFDGVIVGTSRAMYGFNPACQAWDGQSAVNAAVLGATMYEMAGVVQYAIKMHPPKRILLSVDFFSFSGKSACLGDYMDSRFNPARNMIAYHFDNLLGWATTTYSIKSLNRWKRGMLSGYDELGFFQRTEETIKRGFLAGFGRDVDYFTKEFRSYKDGPGHRAAFADTLRQARAAGVELIIVIPPVHAMHLECIRDNGLWDEFQTWKHDLVEMVRQETPAGQQPFALWDFTDYCSYMTERPPPPGDEQTRMKYYWGASHFKPTLGENVLWRTLASQSPQAEGIDANFGKLISPANVDIDSHLAGIRNNREIWAKENPDLVKYVADRVAAIIGTAAQNDSDANDPENN